MTACTARREMPSRPGRQCAHPLCAGVARGSGKYCDAHRREGRRSSARDGYGYRWQQLRRAFLSRPENAVCAICGKAAATVVDHIQPHRGDKRLFWDEANLQPLCKPCHDRKTAKYDGGFGR